MSFLDVAPAGPFDYSSGVVGPILFVALIALVVVAIIVVVLLCIRRSRKKKEAAAAQQNAFAQAPIDPPADGNKTE
jgi:flagellar basal body-associated protein FliL